MRVPTAGVQGSRCNDCKSTAPHPTREEVTHIHIKDLPVEGSNGEGSGRRVVTRHLDPNAEIVTVYPRPNMNLDADTRFRVASLAKKSLAHLGYADEALNNFVENLADTAGIDA